MASRNLVNLVRLQDEELEVAGVLGTTLLEANKGLKETLEKVESEYEAVVSARYEESIKAGAFRKRISKLQHYLEMSEEQNSHLMKENAALRDALFKSEMNCNSVQVELDRMKSSNHEGGHSRSRMQSWATEISKVDMWETSGLPEEPHRSELLRLEQRSVTPAADASVLANIDQDHSSSNFRMFRLPQRQSSLQKLRAYGFRLKRSQSMIEKSLLEPLFAREEESYSESLSDDSIEEKDEDIFLAKPAEGGRETILLKEMATIDNPMYTHFHLTLQSVKYHLEQTGIYYDVRGKEATALYSQVIKVPTYQWWGFIRDTLLTLEPRELIPICNHHKAVVASNLLRR